MTLKLEIPVRGMHCASCVLTIEKAARAQAGVIRADVNLADETASLEVDPSRFDPRHLDRALRERGYRVHPQRVQFRVLGLDASSDSLERNLASLPGVLDAQLNYAAQSLVLDTIRGLFDPAAVQKTVSRAGARLEPVAAQAEGDEELRAVRFRALFAVPAAALLMALMLAGVHVPWWFELSLATLVQFWAGWRYHAIFVLGLRRLSVDMNTLISIGSNAAYFYSLVELLRTGHPSYFETSVTIIAIVLLGRWLELRARRGTREAVRALAELAPRDATVVRDGNEAVVPVADLRTGDLAIVKPGERIPADGTVEEGEGEVDESMLTGEDMPVSRKPGDAVIGGTVNRYGALRIRLAATGDRTVLAQIIRTVREAQGSKAPAQRIADRWAAIFVPIVLGIALLTLLGWLAVDRTFALEATMAVLLVSCPCAFGLATPTAVMVASGRAARLGILLKNASMLEAPGRVTTFVFDKTGTLTAGRPLVREIVAESGLSREEVLRTAAAVEKSSEHPIARAIVAASPDTPAAPDFEARPGLGAIAGDLAVGNRAFMEILGVPADSRAGHIYVARGTKLLGSIEIADAPREEARPVVQSLRARGYRVIMITGDDEATARRIAREIDIAEIRAEVMPQDKAAEIRKLQEAGERVAMVGDGINDAPALAQADVGIAVASGTDVAMESAGIVLVKGGLRKVITIVDLSRGARRVMNQNFGWAFGYNALLIPLAAGLLRWAGLFLNPMLAAAAMAMSSITVVTNSLRLRRFGGPR